MHRIKSVRAFQLYLDLFEGTYTMSGGRRMDQFDTTIVCIGTNTGITGWGEYVPLGANYLPAYGPGARTGIEELAPALIGLDPCELARVNDCMNAMLQGHEYAKSAIDIACWDILGKVANLPVCTLLGGRSGHDLELYRAITHDTPENMRATIRGFRDQGYKKFQLKIGGQADEDIARIRMCYEDKQTDELIVADANCGWIAKDAMRVVRSIETLDLVLEQPCQSYRECLSIRERTSLPFVLDESINSNDALDQAIRDRAMDAINIKLSKFGGISGSRSIRDTCVRNGVAMTIEDTACTDIGAAAVSHLAQSTPVELRQSVTLASVKVQTRTAHGGPDVSQGKSRASDKPGLGIEPIEELFGDAFLTVH